MNPQPSWPHLKALTIKPSPHMMTKNDITKYINTYFEQKMNFVNITIWFNWFGGFIITLNFVNFLIKKCVNHAYSKYSLINKFKCIIWNFELSYIFKYYLNTINLLTFMKLCDYFPFQNFQQLRWVKFFYLKIHM